VFELRVEGADQLARMNRALKSASPELRRELARGIREGTEPLRQETRQNILSTLPTSGGLATAVHADTTIVSSRRGSPANPGIRLRAKSRRNVKRMDLGRLRHPLFGNKDYWYTQAIPPGWFTKPMLDAAPKLRRVLLKHIDNVARKIAGSV
jgi:hypothetical protein